MGLTELVAGAPAVVMLGMCKNAGKTTALCRLIREHAAAGIPIGLTSVGRDGERRDLVTGTDKPPIYLYNGMLAATAERLLPFCDVSREILALTDVHTSLGQVVLFRARSDGYVQLAGPSIVEQLVPLREAFAAFGAERVFIDGALGRRSPAAGAAAAEGCCVLSTGASLDRDLDTVVAETACAVELLTLPRATAPGGAKDRFTLFRNGAAEGAADFGTLCALLKREHGAADVLLAGALTETHAAALLRSGAKLESVRLIAGDGSRYLLKRASFDALKARGVRFAVERETHLAAVTVNPVSAGGWRFDPERFLEKIRAAVDVPALDVGRAEL